MLDGDNCYGESSMEGWRDDHCWLSGVQRSLHCKLAFAKRPEGSERVDN